MNQLAEDIIERGKSLGLSMKTIQRMLDAKTFSEPVSLPSMKERATMNENHHLQHSKGRYYFKLIKNGKCISQPLSDNLEVAREKRDQLLKEYDYR